mmetsp:Transcript_102540/g.289576  ORF Transcript_102540/g.289576 Transcript_102540/m.289576 type:complete len:273 (+) Transcript_102540:1052-1870(+)
MKKPALSMRGAPLAPFASRSSDNCSISSMASFRSMRPTGLSAVGNSMRSFASSPQAPSGNKVIRSSLDMGTNLPKSSTPASGLEAKNPSSSALGFVNQCRGRWTGFARGSRSTMAAGGHTSSTYSGVISSILKNELRFIASAASVESSSDATDNLRSKCSFFMSKKDLGWGRLSRIVSTFRGSATYAKCRLPFSCAAAAPRCARLAKQLLILSLASAKPRLSASAATARESAVSTWQHLHTRPARCRTVVDIEGTMRLLDGMTRPASGELES